MIQKQEQQLEEQLVFQSIQRVKSGRKKKQETSRYLQTPMNPYYKVYERLIQYLERIGLIHGLCFTPQLRKSLKVHNKYPQLKWKQQGKGWEYLDQINDIRKDRVLMARIRKIMFSIKRRVRKQNKILSKSLQEKTSQTSINRNSLDQWTLNKIIDFIIRPGQMVDAECRHQFYTLNTSILQSIFIKKSQLKTMPKTLALKFFKQYLHHTKKKIGLKQKDALKHKCNKNLQKYIVYNFYEWDEYNSDMKELFEQQTRNLDGDLYKIQQQKQDGTKKQQQQQSLTKKQQERKINIEQQYQKLNKQK